MTDNAVSGAMIVVAVLVVLTVLKCRSDFEAACTERGGEVVGLRDQVCVKAGSKIEIP